MSLNNFNGLLEILAGLNNVAVSRLKHIWKQVSDEHRQKLAEFDELMSLKHNRRNYRELLDSINSKPCVPYLGAFLTDLLYLDEANPTEIKPGLINVEKLQMMGRTIHMLHNFQCTPYAIEPNAMVQQFLLEQREIVDDEILYKQSLQIRPLNKNQQKVLT